MNTELLCPGPDNPIWAIRHKRYLEEVKIPMRRKKASLWFLALTVILWLGQFVFLSEAEMHQPPGAQFWWLSLLVVCSILIFCNFAIKKWKVDMDHDVPYHDIPHDPNVA